jgi:hypothetical protein
MKKLKIQLNPENACLQSVKNPLSSQLLEMKMYNFTRYFVLM